MTKKRISIVGRGTAGSQGVLHFYRHFADAEIVWYFNPDKPTQSVGEGSTLELPYNMYTNMGFFHNDLKKVNGTFKTGIYKENWGTQEKTFFHHFPPPQLAYHFSAVELQDYIHNFMKDRIKIVEEDVDYKNIDSDFVLNASGKPSDLNEFNASEHIPVNAAHVVQCQWDRPLFDYTLCVAAKHGWIFAIPLQNRLSVGYIYNKSISSEQDLLEEIFEIFNRYGLSPTKEPNRLSFNNYFRKLNYEMGGRIAHTGNASFFLEPLEATSISTMDKIQRLAFGIWDGRLGFEEANLEYLSLLDKTELVIMLHYAAGSSYESDFWEFAKEKGIKKLEESSKDPELKQMIRTVRGMSQASDASTEYPSYGPWWSGAFFQNLRGLGLFGKLEELRI